MCQQQELLRCTTSETDCHIWAWWVVPGTETLKLLHQAWSKPAVLNSEQFPEAVVKLLYRYRDSPKSQTYRTLHKYQIPTPKLVLKAIIRAFNITNELFASPPNFNSAWTTHCSPYPEDEDFVLTTMHTLMFGRWAASATLKALMHSLVYLYIGQLPALACSLVTLLLPVRFQSTFTSLSSIMWLQIYAHFLTETLLFGVGKLSRFSDPRWQHGRIWEIL